ncbi:hypothetical protein B0H17DRAFT_1150620 [Mycena rosella]|uniref:Uncharacterized protein n=1 Tax=Mycena rosella TaxID=1033263 RepID=A0AAD7BSS8_MYCRO|nr:hypothetical protein B0H17DRAFT_1150620 [Mycena rosella]
MGRQNEAQARAGRGQKQERGAGESASVSGESKGIAHALEDGQGRWKEPGGQAQDQRRDGGQRRRRAVLRKGGGPSVLQGAREGRAGRGARKVPWGSERNQGGPEIWRIRRRGAVRANAPARYEGREAAGLKLGAVDVKLERSGAKSQSGRRGALHARTKGIGALRPRCSVIRRDLHLCGAEYVDPSQHCTQIYPVPVVNQGPMNITQVLDPTKLC